MLAVAIDPGDASLPRLDDELMAELNECWAVATSLHHNYIGTEHMLLEIVGAEMRALKLLRQFGFEGDAVDSKIRQLLGAST